MAFRNLRRHGSAVMAEHLLCEVHRAPNEEGQVACSIKLELPCFQVRHCLVSAQVGHETQREKLKWLSIPIHFTAILCRMQQPLEVHLQVCLQTHLLMHFAGCSFWLEEQCSVVLCKLAASYGIITECFGSNIIHPATSLWFCSITFVQIGDLYDSVLRHCAP